MWSCDSLIVAREIPTVSQEEKCAQAYRVQKRDPLGWHFCCVCVFTTLASHSVSALVRYFVSIFVEAKIFKWLEFFRLLNILRVI